ncbi:protein of unknown function [Candidatus Nitrosotalea okcheonensis]|uniref:Uncharacterized protein n=1 Tax=Candidatus Nitrosotalea okcheonensis TaxID=1903276 RepID=A0A2H1FEQ0_9ARCH|nr:protein of unknown function [Candidatus Nitrosotalea okcheonensis]
MVPMVPAITVVVSSFEFVNLLKKSTGPMVTARTVVVGPAKTRPVKTVLAGPWVF